MKQASSSRTSSKVFLTSPDPSTPTEVANSRPCLPIAGKTAVMIGQDYNSILNYTRAFTTLHPYPFGLMSYTTVKNERGILTGLQNPIDYGAGIEWMKGLVTKYPSSSIQLGLYLVNQLGKRILTFFS
jgi:hypothetical protein